MENMTEQELINLKEDIDSKKAQESELKGKLEYIKKQLNTIYQVKTVKEAEKILEDLVIEMDQIIEETNKRVIDLKEKYSI